MICLEAAGRTVTCNCVSVSFNTSFMYEFRNWVIFWRNIQQILHILGKEDELGR